MVREKKSDEISFGAFFSVRISGTQNDRTACCDKISRNSMGFESPPSYFSLVQIPISLTNSSEPPVITSNWKKNESTPVIS
jgi:cystathionine beta-lyase/cystathionine gamma-synthase